MKHYGDITKLHGDEIDPVDCICGGSPCQDLSVAGKRAGLAGNRSGLFMEQIRIVREMRERDKADGRTDELVRPRFMVWENVPGAYSSNFSNGFGDFGAVLEEIIRISEPDFTLPRLEGGWKWTKSGAIVGDGFSVAWRCHNAQYWGKTIIDNRGRVVRRGTPQRRRRISVVADFGGQDAAEILFDHEQIPPVSQGLPRDTEQGEQERKETSGDFTYGIGEPNRENVLCLNDQGGNVMQVTENSTGTLRAQEHGHQPIVCELQPLFEPHVYDMTHADDVIRDCGERSPTLQNRMGTGGNQIPIILEKILRWIVRRLMPVECERLQGFPDDWTDIGEWTDSKGKTHKASDTPRYKALGNSLCLPFWRWMLKRMAAYLPEHATLGSLFDGIGGFPLIWEEIHGKGTAKWASEIEEFCIAVTKKHFSEE